jgi:hypothetical protein
MTSDPNATATKQDIQLLMEEMGKLYAANERWKNEIIDEVDGRIVASEERTKRHFEVVAEDIKHDFQGAFHDKLQQHEERLARLEQHAGLRA